MDYKELIKSFGKNDYQNRVNLHIHSNFSDGKMTPEQIVKQAKDNGYEHIAICDHNTVEAYLKTDLKHENIVIPAIEFDCWFDFVFIHMLGYGIDPNSEALKPFLAKTKKDTEADIVRIFANRDVKNLIQAIHEAGGIAVLAHPACYWCINMEKYVQKLVKLGLDGLETFYTYDRHRGIIKFHSAKTVEKIADKLNLIKTGGTDCHASVLN